MDFRFTKEQESFRKEVRDFLEEEVRKGVFEPFPNAWILRAGSDEFTRHLVERG